MVSMSIFLTAATLFLGVLASPVRDAETSLQPLEARGKADIVREILKAIGVFTDNKKNAWDFKANKDMCEVFMKTTNGGNCRVSVECQEGGKIEYYRDQKNCHVQGREFINDPRIGEFRYGEPNSILPAPLLVDPRKLGSFAVIFTQRDGNEGEGLTNPVLHVKNVANWKEWDITGMSSAHNEAAECKRGLAAPLRCHEGPWVCRWVHGGNTYIWSDRSKRWSCGVPKVGANFPDGMNWESLW
ncbi:hypothetical protein F5883DRAFT_714624 [Diaporthe sp. PMI_573]|nr:hypothetical protein F5883DRAFT_714624 [Diaporthaceae sp. PMI_573]